MKKFITIIALAVLAASLSGCGTTYKAYSNVKKIQKRTQAALNLQTTPPDTKSYVEYAETPLAKDLAKILDMYNTNPDLIPAKLMDPATNPEAAEHAKKDIAYAKRELQRSHKEDGTSKAQFAQTMHRIEKDLNKPYWELEELPQGVFEGIMRTIEPYKSTYVNSKGGKSLYLRFSYDNDIEKVRTEILAALDSFLQKDNKWVKVANLQKDQYKNPILTLTETNDLLRQVVAENEGNDKMKDYVERTKRDIKKNENMIAYMKKMQAKKVSPITMYKYTWHPSGKISAKNMPSMFSVVLTIKDNNITLNMMKMEYE